MKAIYTNKRVAWLLNGRKSDQGWLPSVKDFDRCVRWVNLMAGRYRCPFAGETIYGIERAVIDQGQLIQSQLDHLLTKNRDSLLVVDEPDKMTIDVTPLSRLSRAHVNNLCKYGLVLDEQTRALSIAAIGYQQAQGFKDRIEKRVRSIHQMPFAYHDRGIRGVEYLGTREWEQSVVELGKSPQLGPYRPRIMENEHEGVAG